MTLALPYPLERFWHRLQLFWPRTIARAINVIHDAPLLSERQKRDILYNNAARFLRLSKEDIARHQSF
jgi:uncharacterized protein